MLEDKKGTIYSIKPDHIGLRFAKGEISYKEYSQIQKKEDLKGFSYFFVIIGFFLIMMFMSMRIIT
jgi:hypothetical protein